MTNTFIAAGSYSIAIAAVIGLIRLPRLPRAYQPFIAICVVSLANEVVSHMLILHKRSNAAAINIFGIFDAIVWLWQFRIWSRHRKHEAVLRIATIVLAVLWFVENIVLGKLFYFGPVYAITFSFAMAILSSVQLTRLASREKENLLATPQFMICGGAVLFYSYRILVECFYAPGMSHSTSFYGNVFVILSFVNVIINLLFALAVLWIPGKQKFSLPYY